MRYKPETCTKSIPKEYAFMMASKNDQICKASHIILHFKHTTSHGNTTQLDNNRKWNYPDGKTISYGTSLGMQIVQAQYNVPTP